MSGSYVSFAARRLVAAFVVAVVVSAITFVMLHVLRPEAFVDPRPLPAELGDYLWRAFTRFDLGQSRQPPFRPVGELIRARMWADFWLFGGALVFGVTAGLVGGVAAGRRPRSLRARALDLAATIALCAPVYWVALLTLLLFGSGIGRIVPLGLVDTGIYRPLSEDPVGWLRSLIVPWIVVGAPLAGLCLRLTAATMRGVGETEYVRTALGKGLSRPRRLPARSPRRGPADARAGGRYTPLLVGNALLVEQVFNIPGVFRYTPGAVSNGDFPLLQGMVLVGAVLVVLGNLAADLALARIDPRVRIQ